MRQEIGKWLTNAAVVVRDPRTCRAVAAVMVAVGVLMGAAGCSPAGEAYVEQLREDVRKQCASSLLPETQALCSRLRLQPGR